MQHAWVIQKNIYTVFKMLVRELKETELVVNEIIIIKHP
jgi:hypothetical protein